VTTATINYANPETRVHLELSHADAVQLRSRLPLYPADVELRSLYDALYSVTEGSYDFDDDTRPVAVKVTRLADQDLTPESVTLTMPYKVAQELRSHVGDARDGSLNSIYAAFVGVGITRHDGKYA